MRSTHPFEQAEVMAYLDGEISADRASEIAQHMQQCAECEELAAGFRDLSRELAAWEIETSPERLTDEMNSEIAAAASPRAMPPIARIVLPAGSAMRFARLGGVRNQYRGGELRRQLTR